MKIKCLTTFPTSLCLCVFVCVLSLLFYVSCLNWFIYAPGSHIVVFSHSPLSLCLSISLPLVSAAFLLSGWPHFAVASLGYKFIVIFYALLNGNINLNLLLVDFRCGCPACLSACLPAWCFLLLSRFSQPRTDHKKKKKQLQHRGICRNCDDLLRIVMHFCGQGKLHCIPYMSFLSIFYPNWVQLCEIVLNCISSHLWFMWPYLT